MNMRSLLPFAAVLATVACGSSADDNQAVTAGSKPFMSMAVKSTTVRGNIAEVSGVGGNVLVIKGKEGTTLLDTGVEPRTATLDEALKQLHARKVTQVVDSHYHFDHTGGNLHYASMGATIIAQQNVKTRLAQPQHIDFFNLTFPPAPAKALPTVTFADSYVVKAGGHTLSLVHPPRPAHTDGDIFIKIADADVIFTGDIYFNKLYPFIDYGVGGNIDGMIAAADQVLANADAKTKIIPGHGDISGKADLQKYRDMLATVSGRVHKLIDAGKSEDEVVAAKPTADFDAVWAKGMFNGEQFTRVVYRGLKN